jgi:hypothetical protein
MNYYGQPIKMELKEYLNALGNFSQFRLVHATGLPIDVVKTALKGDPIALAYAQKIAQYLSQEFERDIQVTDIKELKTINPGREKTQQGNKKAQARDTG